MSPRTGRPPKDDAKRNETRIRMNDEEVAKLNYCCEILGLTKTAVISNGIDRMYEEAQKQAKK